MKTQEMKMDAKCISLNGASHGAGKEQFCKLWPTAKQALVHLSEMVKNPVVKAVVNTVMKTGDAVAGSICTIG